METKTKITSGALALLLLSLTFYGGAQLGDDNLYYCEDLQLVMTCDSLSKYVLPNGKCNNAEAGNRICKTGNGWIPVEEEVVIEKHIVAPGLRYECSPSGCVLEDEV